MVKPFRMQILQQGEGFYGFATLTNNKLLGLKVTSVRCASYITTLLTIYNKPFFL